MAQVGLLEDNTRIAKLCATMLQYAGHSVTIYEHPRACLDALLLQSTTAEKGILASPPTNTINLPIEVLLLDLSLPDIDGLDVVNALLAHPRTQMLPLIFCTAASPSEIVHALRLAPHASAIGKPFTFQELTTAVNHALSTSTK